MAAACGVAADVPKNGVKPLTDTLTPSAAVMSGFWRIAPPVEEKFPAVIAVPFALKKTWRGPSELNNSTGLFVPPKNASGYEFATSVAATQNALLAHGCPDVEPSVAIANTPSLVSKCRKRPEPANFTITI